MSISWSGPPASWKDDTRILETGCVGVMGGSPKLSFAWWESEGSRFQWRLGITLIISSQSRKFLVIGKAAALGSSSGRCDRGREDYWVQTCEEVRWMCGFPSPAVFNARMSEPQQNFELKLSSSSSRWGRGGVEISPIWHLLPPPHSPSLPPVFWWAMVGRLTTPKWGDNWESVCSVHVFVSLKILTG